MKAIFVISIMLSLIYIGSIHLKQGLDIAAYFFYAQAFFAFFLMIPTKVNHSVALQQPQEESNVTQMPKVPYAAKLGATAYAGYKTGKSNLTG